MTDPSVAPGSGSSSPSGNPADGIVDEGTVLVVEDDASIAELLTTALGARGYTVTVTRSAEAALRAATTGRPDVVLLDLGLPDADGLEVCRRLRRDSSVPVIVVTADDDEQRKVAALDLGADDYVTKPFSTPELMARVRVAMRRRAGAAPLATAPATVRVGEVVIDPDRYEVTIDAQVQRVTQKEFRLLHLLASRAGGLVPHREILDVVWDGNGTAESLRVHVTNLRRKLGQCSGVEIRTEPGVGYRLVVVGRNTDET